MLVALRQALTLNENNRLRVQLAGELVLSRRELLVTRREANTASREAQDKQQLEQGVVALQTVHARIARGDFSVRASTEPGPLQAVAVSVNLMIERLKDLALRANRYEQLVGEIRGLQEALEHLSRGTAAWAASAQPASRTELRPLYLGIERVQRFQLYQWKNLLVSLERTALPLGRVRAAWHARQQGETPAFEDGDISMFRSAELAVQQIEQQMQQLIEQTRALTERLEDTGVPPSSPTPGHQYQEAPARAWKTPASQPLQAWGSSSGEGSPHNIPGPFPQKTPRFPQRDDERFS